MEIFLKDLKLERVNFFDEEKINYIEGLLNDELIKKYLGYLKDGISISKNIGYLNSHYVVKRGSNNVGYLYLSPPFIKDKRTSSEIRYAIDSLYRQSSLGNLLVKEISDYILENENIDSLVAIIQKQNLISKHIVENNGYIQDGEDIDGLIFEKSSFRR